ncbi:hypothetical protein ACRC7T_10495, partial [Segnochrobactraceae bacterium EtOH-i3]
MTAWARGRRRGASVSPRESDARLCGGDNRLNRERRSSGDAWKAELAKIEKQIRGLIEAIKACMFHESMKAEMDMLEARKAELNSPLADTPKDTPDILPSASVIYAKKVSALTKALNRKEERQ